MPVSADAPPRWLEIVLSDHQCTASGWCTCSFRELNSMSEPKRYVAFSAQHQAKEVHKRLSDGIASLFGDPTHA